MIAGALAQAVAEGRAGDRLWLYATYHCNLACCYCLTESSPRIADRRTLAHDVLVRAAEEARDLRFRALGVTGGEVFMLPWFPDVLRRLGEILPTVALTNATLFSDGLLRRLRPLAGLDVALQVSLDSADPDRNDSFRAPENFARVVEAIPRLHAAGLRVRIATTVESEDRADLARLCHLHRSLGVGEDDHVVRAVVRRGRAAERGLGVDVGPTDVLPELTLTADGAFLNPFVPTVRRGRTDLDGLVSRRIAPLAVPLERFLRLVADLPAGDDVVRNIR